MKIDYFLVSALVLLLASVLIWYSDNEQFVRVIGQLETNQKEIKQQKMYIDERLKKVEEVARDLERMVVCDTGTIFQILREENIYKGESTQLEERCTSICEEDTEKPREVK